MQILFVVALQSEATTLIKFYKLKLYSETPFKIYRNEDTWLIVSGIGRINCAAATAYLQCTAQNEQYQLWINVGIAGHKDLELGQAIVAHKIVDANTQKKWYPPILVNLPVQTATVITVDVPETNYPTASAYEMEASSFYEIATKFATSEFVHCFKVISDNEEQHIQNITRQKVQQLIEQNMPHIDNICSQLQQVAKSLPPKIPQEWQDILQQWKFTAAGQKRLRNLLQKWQTLNPENKLLNDEMREQCSHMKQVLQFIEKKVQCASREMSL
ncbi:hypothetical protein [Candidatus Uabimicrobium amorphum]|uniref:Membrane protein n=1 Tax=Uabimicrobium amorphum TaxID=2596890 RepID=A0A5S9ILI8_UABAM|nr:hypothetical protein [Candidatus Uabimicrobium amorphum]BBM83656.1 membrane protein [Candidatus Uabimicrobium amorphum]